jgi:16S rRNA (guanine(1405)-N(7))-methyltransferase
MKSATAEEIAARVVASSSRYRTVHPSLIQRMAANELPKSRNAAEAEKRVKRRMHQAFGAYVGHKIPYCKMLEQLRAATPGTFRQACSEAMASHASTRERLAILDDFYRAIFEITGPPESILDVACGLNPLAIPWMNLSSTAEYRAIDIDREMTDFLREFLAIAKQAGDTTWSDAVSHPPTESADVALVLKTVPCLERQELGAGYRLLEAIRSNWLVVSFPTRSLGGVSKGMSQNYRDSFRAATSHWTWPIRELEFAGELVYVIDRRGV